MEAYSQQYYEHYSGQAPYTWDSPVWRAFFSHVADKIVAEFHPETVLDAGCAIGLLVDELRKRGIVAAGFDSSRYATGAARANGLEDIRQLDLGRPLKVPVPAADLVTCIEVVEHLSAAQAHTAIGNLCALAKRHILFSSTPDDFTEPTHLNVQPEDYWLALFAAHGFRLTGRAPWLSAQAIILAPASPLPAQGPVRLAPRRGRAKAVMTAEPVKAAA